MNPKKYLNIDVHFFSIFIESNINETKNTEKK